MDLLTFFGWWQFSVCSFAFVALMGIWWHIGRKQNDFGQVWLAISVLCWSFSGLAEVYFSGESQMNNGLTDDQSFLLSGFRSIFSLFNSLFILLALPWFKYLPKRFETLIKSPYWKFVVGLPFLFSLLPTVSKMVSGKGLGLIAELDVYYAILTLVFLGIVLWESFIKRKLTILAWLSVVFIIITFVAQIYKMIGSDMDMTLFSAIFKTSLIMIFFALALSWVKEISENIIPNVEDLKLAFKKEKNQNGKFIHQVEIDGLIDQTKKLIKLTPGNYELLFSFAKRKKEANEWLEIKPKSDIRNGKRYDINDHIQIKRLNTALLDGIFGNGNWNKEKHAIPLRNTLFEMSEKRERKIKLRIPSNNIYL